IEGFPAALSKLQHLQHLTVHSHTNPDNVAKPLLFLQSCLVLPELTELHFKDLTGMRWDDGDEFTVRRELEAVIHEATVVRFSRSSNAKKIKQLTFPFNSHECTNPLPLLLFKSNLLDLKRVQIPVFGPDASIQEIEGVVRENCSGLKHLEGSDLGEAEDGPLGILSELASRHHTTLETIDIECQLVLSHQLQEVLSSCKLN
ncbi:hypothetical protein BGZ70_006115, partial [Mortierella alpina]